MSTQITNARNIGTGNLRHDSGNVIKTDRYDIHIKGDECKVYDRKTGEWMRFFGDPHIETSDGDRLQFHQGNLTLDLEDGTKVTIVPTAVDANGAAYIDKVIVTNGSKGIEVDGVHGTGSPRFGSISNDGRSMDRKYADGNVLHADENLANAYYYDVDGKRTEIASNDDGSERSVDDIGGSADNRTVESSNSLKEDGIWGTVRSVEDAINDIMEQLEDPNLPKWKRDNLILDVGEKRQSLQFLIQMLSEEKRAQYEASKTLLQNLRV